MRVGFGAMILPGAHKLVAPKVWTKYAAPWVNVHWPETLFTFRFAMILNGVFEVLFGLALIRGSYKAAHRKERPMIERAYGDGMEPSARRASTAGVSRCRLGGTRIN